MHKLAEKIAECLKAKVEGRGIDNIEGQDLIELGMWTDIIKDIAEYDKAMREIEEMDAEEEDGEEDGKRGYRGQPRDSMGRFRSRRGRRSRRGYEEPMYYMPLDMYHSYSPEELRDMDRDVMGRMYYPSGAGSISGMSSGNTSQSGGNSMNSGSRGYSDNRQSDGGQYSSRMQREERDGREGRSGEKRKGYMEAKEQGKDKQEKMKNLEEYTKELSEDVTDMISGMSQDEKTLLKNKLSILVQKIQ